MVRSKRPRGFLVGLGCILLSISPAPAYSSQFSKTSGRIGNNPETMTKLTEDTNGERSASFYEVLRKALSKRKKVTVSLAWACADAAGNKKAGSAKLTVKR